MEKRLIPLSKGGEERKRKNGVSRRKKVMKLIVTTIKVPENTLCRFKVKRKDNICI